MNILSIFSARNVTLLVFILVVLFLGATFDVKVGPESFENAIDKEEKNMVPKEKEMMMPKDKEKEKDMIIPSGALKK